MSFVDLPGQFLVDIRRFGMRPSRKHWPWRDTNSSTWLQATSLFVALSYEALKSDFARMFTEAQFPLCIGVVADTRATTEFLGCQQDKPLVIRESWDIWRLPFWTSQWASFRTNFPPFLYVHYPHIRCTAWRIQKFKKSWRTAPSAWSWAFHATCLPFCQHLQYKVGGGLVDTAVWRMP